MHTSPRTHLCLLFVSIAHIWVAGTGSKDNFIHGAKGVLRERLQCIPAGMSRVAHTDATHRCEFVLELAALEA